jgi:tripartite ATP-independent transporter DctM subunit
MGNALFSFVTGVSIASAAAFSRISYPEMRRHGYDRGFALGTVAGSSCLGMLIPPSVLMIVWGILTEKSIGQIFLAGVIPGLMIAAFYCLYALAVAIIWPEMVGGASSSPAMSTVGAVQVAAIADEPVESRWQSWTSGGGIFLVVMAVFGGIWFGVFTPTEGAGAGAFIALIMALLKGMRVRGVIEAILSVGRTSAPILVLLVTAQLYSRSLAMTGVTNAIQDFFLTSGLGPIAILVAMVTVWFLLGMVIDSISIMLLTVTIFEPIALKVGYDPIAFAIIGILAIEAGLLTPPFGLIVFTVKAAVDDDDVTVWEIFKSSTPYWVIMLIGIVLLVMFPKIATWLPSLAF